MPVAAADESRAISQAHYGRYRVPIGLFIPLVILIGQHVVAYFGALVGPLMGITSLLWLMMRNDAAIDPKVSWMVFGAWSILTLTYYLVQCHRVLNHRLYILLTVAVASFCMGLVAMVQKSSLHGGVVTAIPTCTSFAAYTVAYFFPSRYGTESNQWSTAV